MDTINNDDAWIISLIVKADRYIRLAGSGTVRTYGEDARSKNCENGDEI